MNYLLELLIYFGSGGLSLAIMAAMLAAPLVLIVLLIERCTGSWMTARVRCWMWMLVAVRLLLPIAPSSPVSAVNLWRVVSWSEQAEPVDDAASDTSAFLGQEPADGFKADGPSLELIRTSMADVLVEGRENILPDLAAVATGTNTAGGLVLADFQWGWEEILAVSMGSIWLSGVAIVLLRATIASLRFKRRLRLIPELVDQSLLREVMWACDQVRVGRPGVKLVPGLPTPALFGVWRPTLCLPEGSPENLSGSQIRMIALHEAMHIRRGDGFLAWLLTIVRAIHWFNPVAWFAVKQIETYRELACDDGVREFCQREERKTYANLLLQYASCRPATGLGLLGLSFAQPVKGKGLAKRIEAFIAKKKNSKRLPPMAALAFVICFAIVGLTDAASTQVAPIAEQPLLPIFSVSERSAWDVLQARQLGTETSNPEEVEAREYDLTEALTKVDDVPPEMIATEWLLLWAKAWSPTHQEPTIKAIEGEPNRFSISMPRDRHQFFEAMLAEVCRKGHVEQVVVTTRVLSSEHVENLIDADWLGTIKYAVPEPVSSSHWAMSPSPEDTQEFSLSMEAVSFEYAPYTAFIIGDDKMGDLVRYFRDNEKTSIINAPKVTLFSGQSALISNESLSLFMYGLQSIEGEYATALQPNITVIPEGLKVDLQVLALDSNTVGIRCRLTLSSIDGVTEAILPGAEFTVQTPKATRRTVNVQCQLNRGETLLIAPIAGQRSDGKQTYYYAISAEQVIPEEEVTK